MVPRTGLEPAQLSPLPPQGSASTNFATWAQMKKHWNWSTKVEQSQLLVY